VDTPDLSFEGVVGYATGDADEAAHFFEHTLGLAVAAEDAGLRFYSLGEGVAVAVDITGHSAGDPPYLLFSTGDLEAAAEHFLQRGCQVKSLPWAPDAAGFLARSPEGHTVCVVDERSLADDG
jgi:hypothetical protein